MSKFKPGDKLVVISDNHMIYKKGRILTFRDYIGPNSFWKIKVEEGEAEILTELVKLATKLEQALE